MKDHPEGMGFIPKPACDVVGRRFDEDRDSLRSFGLKLIMAVVAGAPPGERAEGNCRVCWPSEWRIAPFRKVDLTAEEKRPLAIGVSSLILSRF